MRRQPLLLRLAIASLVIGAFALVRNLISTFSTLQDYPNAQFLPVFLSTQSATGGTDLMFVFFVWGPLVFGGIGIALLVAHFLTRAAALGGAAAVVGAATTTASSWQQPQQGGWQPEQQQGWQQQPAAQQQGWQPQQQGWQPEQQAGGQPQQAGWQSEQQPNPIQPLGGTQPPPPNAGDRIQP